MNPINLKDYEVLAKEKLSPDIWAYFSGGAGDEITLKKNHSAWQNIEMNPRPFGDFTKGNMVCELMGKKYQCPILIAPMAHQCLAHPDGELAMAAAASAQECGLILSTQTSKKMQDVAKVYDFSTNAPLWFQMYLQQEDSLNIDLIQQAEESGYQAIVLTVDATVNGARDRERQSNFKLPPQIKSVHLSSVKEKTIIANNFFEAASYKQLTWDKVDWLISHTKLPVLLKGITHPEDALTAQKHGVQGLIISNHGGRILDTMPATAHSLARMQSNPELKIPLLVDGGIRRGTDIFKAIALGASAVLVGRPMIYALSSHGAEGVAHALRLLKDELAIAMILSGAANLQAITREKIILEMPANFGS